MCNSFVILWLHAKNVLHFFMVRKKLNILTDVVTWYIIGNPTDTHILSLNEVSWILTSLLVEKGGLCETNKTWLNDLNQINWSFFTCMQIFLSYYQCLQLIHIHPSWTTCCMKWIVRYIIYFPFIVQTVMFVLYWTC